MKIILKLIACLLFGVLSFLPLNAEDSIDAEKKLLECAGATIQSDFTATTQYPFGNPKDLEADAKYFQQAIITGEEKKTRIDVKFSASSSRPGETGSFIFTDEATYLVLENIALDIQGDLKKIYTRPNIINDFYHPFMVREYYTISFGNTDVLYDNIPCMEILMKRKAGVNSSFKKIIKFIVSKDSPILYCVIKYNENGVAEDIRNVSHTRFTNMNVASVENSVFEVPIGLDIIAVSTMDELKKHLGSQPAVTSFSTPIGAIIKWITIAIVVLVLMLLAVIIAKIIKKKRN